MAVKQIGISVNGIRNFTGLTADTTTWLASNTTLVDGSTYRELDGTQRMYELQNGIWYLQ